MTMRSSQFSSGTTTATWFLGDLANAGLSCIEGCAPLSEQSFSLKLHDILAPHSGHGTCGVNASRGVVMRGSILLLFGIGAIHCGGRAGNDPDGTQSLAGSDARITSISVVSNPGNGAVLMNLTPGSVINLDMLPTHDINLLAAATASSGIQKIDFKMGAFTHTELAAPYSL